MKSTVCTFDHLMQIIWRVPDNTYFLCINHRYDFLNRYTLYKSVNGRLREEVYTNSKEEMKIFFDLNGFNINEKCIIRSINIDTFGVELEAFILSNPYNT